MALASAASAAAGPGMLIGAAEDHAKSADPIVSKAKMDLAQLVGFDAIRITEIWTPGQTQLEGYELLALQNAAAAANLNGIRVIVSVYHKGSRTTPLTAKRKLEFAEFAASIAVQVPTVTSFIIGNEPNLNRFWMPQFNKRDGSSASPGGYLGLLAVAYDRLKAVSPDIEVIGGSVSPRGDDRPFAKRQTHSPYRFIIELGRVYRRSGRERPVMDTFAFHPYGDHSSLPPDHTHNSPKRIGIAEYDELVDLLGQAFDGTAQAGSRLPILYDEYGVEAKIPTPKAWLYSGREPRTTRPTTERNQAIFYRRALELASCQPTVKGFLIFHVEDETDLDRWQSGVFYPDGTPKSSFPVVRDAIADTRRRMAPEATSVSQEDPCDTDIVDDPRPPWPGPRSGR